MQFLKLVLIAALLLFGGPAFAQTTQRIYSTIEFTGPMAQNAKALTINSGNFVWPGDVLSTSVKSIAANLGDFAKISQANVMVVWTAQPGAKLRLVSADPGPTNIQNLWPWVEPTITGSPTVSGVNVTSDLNALLAGGVWKQIGIQTSGSATINRATLEIIWEIDFTALADRVTSAEARLSLLEAEVGGTDPEPEPEPAPQEISVPPEGITLRFTQGSP